MVVLVGLVWVLGLGFGCFAGCDSTWCVGFLDGFVYVGFSGLR